MSQILNQMLVLLIMLAIGCVAGKAGIISLITNERLTKVVINVVQPALILDSLTGMGEDISYKEVGICVLVGFSLYIIALAVSFITTKLMRASDEDKGTYQYILIFGNVSFMGFPVISSIFGSDAVFYCALCNIPFHLLVYSIGLNILTKGTGGFKFRPKRLLNMPFLTTIAALILFLIRFKMPTPLADCFNILGGATTPMAMLILGGSLSMVPFLALFTEWRIYMVTFVKLLVLPVITWLVVRLFLPPDSLLLGIIVVLAGMPVATNATMMTIEFGGNQQLVSKGIFFTTVFCVVTIPLISCLLLS